MNVDQIREALGGTFNMALLRVGAQSQLIEQLNAGERARAPWGTTQRPLSSTALLAKDATALRIVPGCRDMVNLLHHEVVYNPALPSPRF